MKSMTNKELQKLFDKYNVRFFASRLTGVTIKFENLKEHDGVYRFTGHIAVHRDFSRHPEIAKLVLFHEMVHADIMRAGYIGHIEDGGHELIFHNGIDRLYRVGAYEGLL